MMKRPVALDQLPQLIKMIRTGKRLTQAQVAKRAGHTHHTVCLVENGKHANLATQLRILEALGFSATLNIISISQE